MKENLPYCQIPLVVIDTQCKLSSIYIKEQDILIAGTGNDSLLLEQCDCSN